MICTRTVLSLAAVGVLITACSSGSGGAGGGAGGSGGGAAGTGGGAAGTGGGNAGTGGGTAGTGGGAGGAGGGTAGTGGGSGPDCVALNAGAPIMAAKAALTALQMEVNAVANCSASNACYVFRPSDAGSTSCYGVSTDKSVTTLTTRDADFFMKYFGLTSDERTCFPVAGDQCTSFVCVNSRCQPQ